MSERRIAIISQLPPPVHGSTVMTRALIETLNGLGYSPQLIDRRYSRTIAEVGHFNLSKIPAGIGLLWRVFWATRRKQVQAVVLFATNSPFSCVSDWLISEILRLRRIPIVNYPHTIGFRRLAARNRLWRLIVTRLLTSANNTVCLGPSLIDDLVPWVKRESVKFIKNFAPSPPVCGDDRQRQILYLSNLLPGKGPDIFVEVAIRIARERHDLTFLVAGSTSDKEYENSLIRRVERASMSERIEFLGAVQGMEKWRLLKSSGLMVFPSLYQEAQPVVLLEAQRAKTRVIATDVGGVRDLVDDSGWLTLVPAGDVDQLERAVRLEVASAEFPADSASQSSNEQERYATSWKAVLERLANTS